MGVAHRITRAELIDIESAEPPSLLVRALLRGVEVDDAIDGHVSVARFYFLRGVGVHGVSPSISKAGELSVVYQSGSEARGLVLDVLIDGIIVVNHDLQNFDTTSDIVSFESVSFGVPSAVVDADPVLALPAARYRDLMIEGARFVGMEKEVVQTFQSMPCVPRKPLSELQRLPVNPCVSNRRFSKAELNNDKEMFKVFRGMVFRRPEAEAGVAAKASVADRLVSKGADDSSLLVAAYFYDPLHGTPPEDPSEAWVGWPYIEDWFASFIQGWTHVGWTTVPPVSRL